MKPLVKTVASTAVVLAALAGCASRSSGGSTSAAGAGSGATSSTSSAPSDGTTSTQNGSQPGAPNSSASSGAPSGDQQPGQSTGSQGSKPPGNGVQKITSPQGVSLGTDGRTLVTEVEWGGCDDQPQLVVLSQDATKVVVEVKTTNHAKIGVMCPDFARQGSASVKLDAPLGSRQVIDGVKNVAISVH